jgi:hypothetical protein
LSIGYRPSQFLGIRWWTAKRAETSDADAWEAARLLGTLALAGVELVPSRCRGATSFNQATTAPGLAPLCRIGAHQFYREKKR